MILQAGGTIGQILVLAMTTGIGTAVGGSIGKYGLGRIQRPSVDLKVSGFEIEGKEYGNIRGFVVRVGITNHGKRIATKTTLSPVVIRDAEAPKFVQVRVVTDDGRKTYTKEPVDKGVFPYDWDSKRNGTLKPWEELKKDDTAFVIFPSEDHPGTFIGTTGPGRSTFHGSEYHDIVEFKPSKYRFQVDVKAEDPYAREIVTFSWKKSLDLTKAGAYAKYGLRT
jgi:hypothetical protein